MRDDLFAEEADRVEHLLVLGRPDGAEEEDFLDPERLVHLKKADAVLGRADAEFAALFAHLLGRRLAGVRPAGEALVAGIIALVIRRHGRWVIVAPHQASALALLLDVPANQFGAAPRDRLRILMAVAGRHQRGAPGRPARGSQRILIERHKLLDAIGAAFAAEEAAHPEAAGEARRLVAAAGRPQRRVRALYRLREDLAARDLEIFAVVGDLLLRPDPRQELGEFLPHPAGVLEVRPIGGDLVGIAGAPEPDINPPAAQDVERRHARGDVQWVVDRREDDADPQADRAGALADRRQRQVGGAVVRPHRAEMVLGEPHALKALLFGVGDLLERLMDALRLAGGGPGLGHLDLIEETNSHRIFSPYISHLTIPARNGLRRALF